MKRPHPATPNRPVRPTAVASILLAAVLSVACAPTAATAPPVLEAGMVTDDFERSSLGTAWSVQPPGVAAITTGDLSSASDALMIATYIAQSFSPDQFSEAVLSPTFSNDNLRGVQVFVRRDPGTRQRYGFFVDNQTRIYTLKLDGGDPGIVLREAPGEFFRANDVIRIEAVGNLIRGIVNGVERISVRNDRLVQGQPGLVVNATAAFVPHVFAGWRGGTL